MLVSFHEYHESLVVLQYTVVIGEKYPGYSATWRLDATWKFQSRGHNNWTSGEVLWRNSLPVVRTTKSHFGRWDAHACLRVVVCRVQQIRRSAVVEDQAVVMNRDRVDASWSVRQRCSLKKLGLVARWFSFYRWYFRQVKIIFIAFDQSMGLHYTQANTMTNKIFHVLAVRASNDMAGSIAQKHM
jgi:hypothetical protein